MNTKLWEPILLFISLTLFMQFFYAISANTDYFTASQYFPTGYIIQIGYYLAFIVVTFLYVGKFDLKEVGLTRSVYWKRYLFVGIALALLSAGIRLVTLPGAWNSIVYPVPYYVLVVSFVTLAIIIAFAEESAFRGFITKNFLERFHPATAIFAASVLYGIYHVNYFGINLYSAPFWALYAVEALTGGLIMATLFYRTGGNLISPLVYHATSIAVGQLVLWTAIADTTYVLLVGIVTNLVLLAVVRVVPIKKAPLLQVEKPVIAKD